MANRYRNLIYSTAEYTHLYSGFRGVELNASSAITAKSRLSYIENMYKDYDGDGADVIESVPGYRCFADYGKTVHALYYQRSPFGNEDHLLVHVGDKIFRHPLSDTQLTSTVGDEIATVRNGKSFGFEHGRYFYIMDNEKILQIGDDGSCNTVGESGALPYVPTTYVAGEEYEQRNLLTDSFKEEFYISDPGEFLFCTEDLRFTITDYNLRYCTLTGTKSLAGGDVYIPAYVNIGGISYKVTAIADSAFSKNPYITAVYIPDGVTVIGEYAFLGCTSVHTVVVSSTVTDIGNGAFSGCTALKEIYFGASLASLGYELLKDCNKLERIHYALGKSDLDKIAGGTGISGNTTQYNSVYKVLRISLPLRSKASAVSSVTANGVEKSYTVSDAKDGQKRILITFDNSSDASDVKVIVSGTLMPLGEEWSEDMNSLAELTPYRAIVNCRVAEVFDGRIFFSGNPDLPNTVFYTERPKQGQEGALYVGEYNFFNDGVGSYKVKSMLAVRDMLAVFKEGDDGSGSIFYHSKEASDLGPIDTIYPVAYVHSGICSSGTCISFLDDPVFLTNEGLMALNHENINYQRNIVCRSHNVNYYLLKEGLSDASLCEWLGYLVIGVNGKIFLGDSRALFTHPTGAMEYEWFFMNGIGAYRSDHRVYRYSQDPYLDAAVHPTLVGEPADHTSVYGAHADDGTAYFYSYEGGKRYSVVPTEERAGGYFSPASVFASHGKLLFFATGDGHLCVFNNDRRGVAPDSVRNSPDYDEEKYREAMGTRLHPLFYSFVGHAPSYVVRTALDDCGVPHLTKSTVKKSLVIKAKSVSADAIRCEVRTDERAAVEVGSFPAAPMGFDDFGFDFAPWYKSRYASVCLPENEKRWIEKQITLRANSFASPISVYSISYRYMIKGKIKNNS